MRDFFPPLVLALGALVACTGGKADMDDDTADFQRAAEAFQQLYTAGSENCERIMLAVAEDVELVENGEAWGYPQLEEFCPHLPEKKVVDAWSDRTVIGSGLGYEFVTLVYENDLAARRRETTARVWRRTEEGWKTIRMSSVLSPALTDTTPAESTSPLAAVKALRLETTGNARVTSYFAPTDREHAQRLAALVEDAVGYFERQLGASFPMHMAVLTPEHWFVWYPGGDSEPYGIPWASVEDMLIVVPASLEEGVLISGADTHANLRRIRFVLLHEFGHIASKKYLHPESPRPYSSVWWFEEFVATYFAYAYVGAHDPEWAQASRKEWLETLKGYTPDVLSLDWGFMHELAPEKRALTYAWYQNLLNLWVADLYEARGLDLLRALGDRLPWEDSGAWTTETLLVALEEIAPGFAARADNLRQGDYLRDIEGEADNPAPRGGGT